MVEAESGSLMLENERQRQQYEKCLDEIANQVAQALLAHKGAIFKMLIQEEAMLISQAYMYRLLTTGLLSEVDSCLV
ncbi:unnamed protein product [Lymnaea stagnalis]|uniref:Uncharacterized protein n=1 Tax=Lymnaea stagnalis TaxID=6523 RepID=A0AAV2IED5_LYMST